MKEPLNKIQFTKDELETIVNALATAKPIYREDAEEMRKKCDFIRQMINERLHEKSFHLADRIRIALIYHPEERA